MEKLLNEMGNLQEKIDAANAWELDRQLEIAMDAMRLPPPGAPAAAEELCTDGGNPLRSASSFKYRT